MQKFSDFQENMKLSFNCPTSYFSRWYVINAVQNGRTEKVVEFFDKMASDIQSQSEWRDWFGEYNSNNNNDNGKF